MNDSKSQDRRITWLMVAVAFNTATSLAAIGLWFFSPIRSSENAPAALPAETAAPMTVAQRPPFGPIPQRPPGQTPPFAPAPTAQQPQPIPPARFDAKSSNAKIAPGTMALAERLQLEPQILARDLGDESGEVPKIYANRLERAAETAKSMAKRQNLDESKTQSLVALVTYYAFALLREEKMATPNPPDPTRLEALTNQTVTDIRSTCGEDTSAAAARELEKL